MSEKYLNLSGLGTLWAKVKARLATKQDDISDILPTDASASNRLATKAYADAIGERLEARYLGSDASGNPFPSHAALAGATAYYYQGSPASPDTNDITTVTSDEDHPGDTGQPSTTRYRWNGAGWSFEYVINNTGLSESQLLAVNSGITATKVAGYDGLSGQIASEASARQTADALKLNVDGSNADEPGVVEILKQVPTGSATLSDLDNFLGCGKTEAAGDDNNKKTVRRPVTDIWNYVKGKIGSAGSASLPVYISDGVPRECTPILPYNTIDSGSAIGYGVYVGGNSAVGSYTRCYCAFLLTATASPDMTAHTYIGTFTFRHGSVLNYELKCLTGTPQYPLRIAIPFNKNSDSTYNLGAYVIPADSNVNTYANYKITHVASSAFTWACTALDATAYAALDSDGAKTALVPARLFFNGGGSNVKTTGGSWIPTFNQATISNCRGIVDLSVQVDLSLVGQTTYVSTLTSYDITLVNSAGTDILPAAYHQSGIMPKATKSSTSGGTVGMSCTHRFVFPITATSNLLAGYRPKITLPSNYALDSAAQVNISATCSGIVLPYYGTDTSF